MFSPSYSGLGYSSLSKSAQILLSGEQGAPVLDVDSTSSNGVTKLVWTEGASASVAVYRSKNGGDFSPIASVSGSLMTYTDTEALAVGEIRSYKVIRTTGGVASSQFSNQVDVANVLTISSAGNVLFPTLRLCYGNLTFSNPGITDLSFPRLKRIRGEAVFTGLPCELSAPELVTVDSFFWLNGGGIRNPVLPFLESASNILADGGNLITLNLPSLVSGEVAVNQCPITTLNVPKLVIADGFSAFQTPLTACYAPVLQTCNFQIDWELCLNLTRVNLPALTNANCNLVFDGCELLSDVSIPNAIIVDGYEVRFPSCALTETSVNHILARCAASGLTNSLIDLSFGTNAAPTGQGAIDAAALATAGCTVLVNP